MSETAFVLRKKKYLKLPFDSAKNQLTGDGLPLMLARKYLKLCASLPVLKFLNSYTKWLTRPTYKNNRCKSNVTSLNLVLKQHVFFQRSISVTLHYFYIEHWLHCWLFFSVIGTSSLRRAAQLQRKFPTFMFENIVSLLFEFWRFIYMLFLSFYAKL